MKIQTAAITNSGLVRAHNEDAYYISSDRRLLAVADGMGGEAGGAVASKLAVEVLADLWKTAPPDGGTPGVMEWMTRAVDTANSTIFNVARADPGLIGMGTTLTCAVLGDVELVQIAHVGDSRAYLMRQNVIELITCDHSTVQELINEGKMTEQEARNAPGRHLLTRCLGYERQLKADFTSVKVQANDRLILCSDGLPKVVDDEGIMAIASQCINPDEVCRRLIDVVLQQGAPDNVTIVVAEFVQA